METLLHQTTSLCRVCKAAVAADVVADAQGLVWMRKSCPQHGDQQVQLSDDATWYEQTRRTPTPAVPPKTMPKPVEHGCPFDCGACQSHLQKVRLPVVTITSACQLACPICYVHNKNDDAFHMGKDEFARVLAALVAEHDGDVELINFTGGEPTLHPHLLEFLQMSKDAGVHRFSLCSNGMRIAQDDAFARRLGELGARVALSFDSLQADADFAMQGAHLVALKLKCLDVLQKYDIDTTLIPVMTKGVNDGEIGDILRLAMARPNIRHVEVHTMTYTGPGGVQFDRSGRISIREVLARIEQTTDGWLRPSDFVPSPAAHPLCYQIAYLLLDPAGGPPVPFARFIARETLVGCLREHLYMEPTRVLEVALREAIDRLWTEGGDDAERVLGLLKALLNSLFPPGRSLSPQEALRVSERATKAVYVHSHMDEETFDVERLAQCCDSNCYADGTTIPVCAYNVLYREKEPRFMAKPQGWGTRQGQKLPLARLTIAVQS